MTLSTTTLAAFLDRLQAHQKGLWAVIAPGTTVGRRLLAVRSQDDHAVHAVQILAERLGLRTLRTQTDEGLHVVSVRGFAR